MIDPNCEKPSCPGYVVLGRSPTDNAYQAVIENSFSMDISSHRANFFWSGEGVDNLVGKTWQIDGLKTAERYRDHFNERRPGMTFEVFDVHSPDLPIVIDWDGWRAANAPSDRTVSGVVDKFGARNPRFEMRE